MLVKFIIIIIIIAAKAESILEIWRENSENVNL